MSVDTAENRFVKHVLLDVEQVCRSVVAAELVTGALLVQCHQLLQLSRSLLRLNFFQDVGRLHCIPYSSPTLNQRHGYRDLYRIYMRCRMGAKHLFDDIAEEALIVELKDVSLLYEYWVFYKIAANLLKAGALYGARSAVVKDGRIVNTAAVSDGEWTVHFNRTYSRKPAGSYSLRLRPDIVIERNTVNGASPAVHVLDAKYKSVEYGFEDDDDSLFKTIRVVKSADIHKMHCYIDAIQGVNSACAVYPGSKFIFYPRDRTVGPAENTQAILALSGVGAVPLTPGASNTDFNDFLILIRSCNEPKPPAPSVSAMN